MRRQLTVLLATTLGVTLAGPIAGHAATPADPGAGPSAATVHVQNADVARVRSVVKPGTVLRAGDIRRSPNRKFQLQMQRDGNLVLYRRSTQKPLWATDTSRWHRAAAAMQRDGNFVVYNRHRKPVYATTTNRHRGARMKVLNSGNLVILSRTGKVLWSRWREIYQIWPGHRLRPGALVQSPNRKHRLTMQRDGNLVLREHTDGRWVRTWSSRTGGHRGAFAELGLDGNFVVYGPRRALWASDTHGNGRVILGVHSDGNVVMYKRRRGHTSVLWQTHTAH